MADMSEVQPFHHVSENDDAVERIARERAMIAVGAAELDRGESYDWSAVKAWIEALEHNPDAKLPSPTNQS